MNTVELKSLIISRIQNINDKTFLNALKALTNKMEKTEIYKLNSFEKEKILKARENIKKGEVYTNEEVFKEIDEWLKK